MPSSTAPHLPAALWRSIQHFRPSQLHFAEHIPTYIILQTAHELLQASKKDYTAPQSTLYRNSDLALPAQDACPFCMDTPPTEKMNHLLRALRLKLSRLTFRGRSDEKLEFAAVKSLQSLNPDEPYCEECLRVDDLPNGIPSTLTQEKNRNLSITLKSDPSKIRNDAKCPSCRDILVILQTRAPEAECVKLMLLKRPNADPDSDWDLGEATIAMSTSNAKDWEDNDNSTYLLQRSMYPLQLRNRPQTSTRANNLPMGLIEPWLQTCEHEHSWCRRDSANRLDISLYVIDVVEECITIMPVSEVRYLALSYVWGDVEFTKLTFDNVEALQKPQSLALGSPVATVPRTIRDAMCLTADLDTRYLWVDCLCLIQNDPNIGMYLDRMHLIYANAYLTIIVANKSNAGGGITGYESELAGRELPGEVINYPSYVLGMEAKDTHVSNPPWSSRGWTLQEGFFSRRVLVISDRIFWVCMEIGIEEGMAFGAMNTTNYSAEAGNLEEVLCQSSPYRGMYETDESEINGWPNYAGAASSFASRKLTYDSDAFKAFLGITSFFTRPDTSGHSRNTDLLYWHPVRFLAVSLVWSSHGFNLTRRALPLRQDGSFAIPSWSWMAWHHSDQSSLWDFVFSEDSARWEDLQIPTVIHAQCISCLETHEACRKRCCNERSLTHIDPTLLSPYLRIEAQRGHFLVSQHPSEKGRFLVYHNAAQSGDRSKVGELIFDHRPSELEHAPTIVDLVGIGCDNWITFEGNPRVRALCIRPVEDSCGVFARLGIAEIRRDAWDQVAEFDRNIILG